MAADQPGPSPLPAAPSRPVDSQVEGRFRYVRRLAVRFGDLDALGHVNHVTYLTYVEQVRTQYFHEVLGIAVPDGLSWVIASVCCDFRLPLLFGDDVDVGWRIGRLGGASAEYELELRRGPTLAGAGGGVLVNADPRAGRSIPMPEVWRAAISTFEDIPARGVTRTPIDAAPETL